MAFPGTYNISYYYGDTFEFNVVPKRSDGEQFRLEDYSTAKFTIAPSRGASINDQISCYAVISEDKTRVNCAIRPSDSALLNPSLQYVYDVEVTKPSSSLIPYDTVQTLLTGNISITQDVTLPTTQAPEEIPDNPTNLVTGTITDSTIQVSWTAPTSGGALTGYKVAIIPFTTNAATIEETIENATTVISSNNLSYTFFGLQENADYSVMILGTNSTGDASYSSVLTNTEAITTSDDPTTVDPDFFITNNSNIEYLVDGVSNDTITVYRGQTYVLNINAPGHPFHIQTSPPPYDSNTEYSTGVAGNGTEVGNIIWTVDMSTPDTLFYVCQFHQSMGGTIQVLDDPGAS